MSNFDKAVEVLNKHWSVAQESGEADETRCCVRHLQEAGLLAPDLPVPELGWWEIGTQLIRAVTLGRGGKVALMPEGLAFHETHIDVEEARTLAYALLAAANYAEQERS